MENNLIMFNSVTLAMRSRDILKRHSIFSSVIRTPAHLRQKSCGYSLLVKGDFDNAVSIISNHKIPIIGTSAVDFR